MQITAPRDRLVVLDNFTVSGPQRAQIPLQILAHIEEDRGWARIQRIDRVMGLTTVFGDRPVEARTV
jgi:hydrophobic/amphiphilic exporter-1 (mainly G- bacteria), HAE1 family